MNNEDLQQLKALAEAATPNWYRDQYGQLMVGNDEPLYMRGATIACAGSRVPQAEKNSDYIAAVTPQTILALIAKVESLATPSVASSAPADELPPLTMAVYGTAKLLEAERHRRCAMIVAAGEANAAEFEVWAKVQNPPYYLKLNKYRMNEGNRWYESERTQHTFEGFVKGRAAIAASQQAAPKAALTDLDKMLIIGEAQADTDDWAERLSYDPSIDEVRAHFFDLIAAKIVPTVGPNAALVEALQSIIAKYHSGQMVGGCAEIEAARAALASLPPTAEA